MISSIILRTYRADDDRPYASANARATKGPSLLLRRSARFPRVGCYNPKVWRSPSGKPNRTDTRLTFLGNPDFVRECRGRASSACARSRAKTRGGCRIPSLARRNKSRRARPEENPARRMYDRSDPPQPRSPCPATRKVEHPAAVIPMPDKRVSDHALTVPMIVIFSVINACVESSREK